MRPRFYMLAPAMIALLSATGCLRRIEVIEIAPDGSAKLTTHVEGEEEDVRTGLAQPSEAAGWTVEQRKEQDDDQTRLILIARRQVPAGQPLPETYAAPEPGSPQLDLHWSTSIRVDRRPDGTYYHFSRRYSPRLWAQFDYFQEQLLGTGEIRELAGKDPKELSDAQRAQLAERLIEFEKLRVIELLAQASASSTFLPQEVLLKAQQAVVPLFGDARLHAETVEILRGQAGGDAMNRLESRLLQQVRTTVEKTLTDAGIDAQRIREFQRIHDQAHAEYNLTSDLGDDHFVVAVRMPGRIVAHNCLTEESQPADTAAAEPDFAQAVIASDVFPRGPDRVGWKFEGNALYDRQVVLMATSFVPATADK